MTTTKEIGDIHENNSMKFLEKNKIKFDIKEIKFYKDVDGEDKKKFRLPNADKGIDIIAYLNTGKIIAIQCKYRSNSSISFDDISTTLSLTACIEKKYISGLMFIISENAKISNSAREILDNFSNNNKKINLLIEKIKDEQQEIATDAILLRPYQQKFIDNVLKELLTHNKCTSIVACGCGKTLMSMIISLGITISKKNGRIIIFVPNLTLIYQFKREILKIIDYCKFNINISVLMLADDNDELSYFNKNTVNEIKILLSTYHSGYKIVNNDMKKINFIIFDEAHHLCCEDDKNDESQPKWTDLLEIKSERKLFMTATEKILMIKNKEKKYISFSMDNIKLYGRIIFKYSFIQAIKDKYISDFNIVVFSSIKEHKKYGKIHLNFLKKALECATKKYNLKKTIVYFEICKHASMFAELFDIDKCKFISSKTPRNERKSIIKWFSESSYGIISNVNIFAEGVDIPDIDSVMFSGCKKSSIGLIQKIGRGLRLFPGKKDLKVILPIIINDENDEIFYMNVLDPVINLSSIMISDIKMCHTRKQKLEKLINSREKITFLNLNNEENDKLRAKIINKIKYLRISESSDDQLKVVIDFIDINGRKPMYRSKDIIEKNLSAFLSRLKIKYVNNGLNARILKIIKSNEILKKYMDDIKFTDFDAYIDEIIEFIEINDKIPKKNKKDKYEHSLACKIEHVKKMLTDKKYDNDKLNKLKENKQLWDRLILKQKTFKEKLKETLNHIVQFAIIPNGRGNYKNIYNFVDGLRRDYIGNKLSRDKISAIKSTGCDILTQYIFKTEEDKINEFEEKIDGMIKYIIEHGVPNAKNSPDEDKKMYSNFIDSNSKSYKKNKNKHQQMFKEKFDKLKNENDDNIIKLLEKFGEK